MACRKFAALSAMLSSSFKDLAKIGDEMGVLLLDGGTGEELLRRGMPDDRTTWSALAVSDPHYHTLLKDVHPLVESYRPDLILPHEQGVETYGHMIDAMSEHVDGFLAETMSSVEESMQATFAVNQRAPRKPLLVSFTLNSVAQLRSGEEALPAMFRLLDFTSKHSIKGERNHKTSGNKLCATLSHV